MPEERRVTCVEFFNKDYSVATLLEQAAEWLHANEDFFVDSVTYEGGEFGGYLKLYGWRL